MISLVVLSLLRCSLDVVVIGAGGGLDESDLSAYLVSAPAGGYVLVDAGSWVHGVDVARARGALKEPSTLEVLKKTRAVLLSHAHLDHTLGLVVASPDDHARAIFALAPTIAVLRSDAFNWRTWPNLASDGEAPALKKFTYTVLTPALATPIADSGLSVRAFTLSHARTVSTAFVLEGAQGAIAYVGDTGPDSVEHTDKLQTLWKAIAPLVRNHSLKAIFIESSFASAQPDAKLYGHLTPKHLSAELIRLALAVDPAHPDSALSGLTIVVTHVKPTLYEADASPDLRGQVRRELDAMNTLGVTFVLAEQGTLLSFP